MDEECVNKCNALKSIISKSSEILILELNALLRKVDEQEAGLGRRVDQKENNKNISQYEQVPEWLFKKQNCHDYNSPTLNIQQNKVNLKKAEHNLNNESVNVLKSIIRRSNEMLALEMNALLRKVDENIDNIKALESVK